MSRSTISTFQLFERFPDQERGSRIDGVILIDALVFKKIDDAASCPWTRIFVWDAPRSALLLEAPIGGTLTLEAL